MEHSQERMFGDKHEEKSVPISNENEESSLEDFEIISDNGLPDANSDEILNITNASYSVGVAVRYLQQFSEGYLGRLCEIPMPVDVPNLGIQDFIGTYFLQQNINSDSDNVTELLREIEEYTRIYLSGVTSLQDEIRRRDCLVRAVSENCREVIIHKVTGSEMEMGLLERRGCITSEDKEHLKDKSDDSTQCMRALFSMMLDRDLKTLLTFVWILKLRNNILFEGIISAFEHYVHIVYCKQLQCLRCVLIDRVNIRLVADYFSRFKTFYQKVIEAKLSESAGLWKEFFEIVNSRNLYAEVMPSLLKAIEACGFHSDILMMMKNDVGSFECRCLDICRDCKSCPSKREDGDCSIQPLQVQSAYLSTWQNPVETEDNNTTLTLETGQNASCSTRSRGNVSLERPLERNPSGGKVERENIQCQWVVQKRKISQMEDAKVDERPIKKATGHSVDSLEKSKENANAEKTSADSTLTEANMRVISQNVERNHLDKSAKEDSLDNLKMGNLKVGVQGYDSERDSGFSPDPSLLSFVTVHSDGDSGVYDGSTMDRHETIPKQVVNVSSETSSQSIKTEQNQDMQRSEHLRTPLSIDAENPEGDALHVYEEALIDALKESSENDDSDGDSESSFNASQPDHRKEENDQMQNGFKNEPFINIMIKRNK